MYKFIILSYYRHSFALKILFCSDLTFKKLGFYLKQNNDCYFLFKT